MIWHKVLKKHASGLFELSNFNFRSTFPFENMFWSTTFTGMKKKLDFRFQKMLEGFSFLPKETCWVICHINVGTYSSHWRRAQHPTVVTNFKLPTIVRMLLRKCFTDEIVIVCAVCFKDDGSHSFSNQFSENHHFWCSWGDERLYGKSIITSFV